MDFDDKILLEKYTLINEVVSVSDLTNTNIVNSILTIPINGTPIKFKITKAGHDVSGGATNWKLQGVPVDDVVGVKDQAGNDIVPGETKIYTIIKHYGLCHKVKPLICHSQKSYHEIYANKGTSSNTLS